jgi:hypothetical protein
MIMESDNPDEAMQQYMAMVGGSAEKEYMNMMIA